MVTLGAVASIPPVAVSQGLEFIQPAAAKDAFQIFQAASVNNPPQIDPLPDRTIDEESTLSFVVTASDPDVPPQKLTFRLGAGALTGAGINPTNGLFTWTPTEGQGPGTNLFGVIVTDDGSPSMSATQRFTVVVLESNRPPVIPLIADQTVNEGDFVIASVLATDPDLPLQSLTFTLAEAPAGASLSDGGLFLWTPAENQGPSTNRVVVIATDDGSPSLSATQQFTIIVREVNYPPVLAAIPEQSVNEGELLAFTIQATDPDLPAQRLTFTLGGGAPDGASINPTNGLFTWTPTEAQGPNSYFFAVIVTDDGAPARSADQGFIVVVREVNQPPVWPPLAEQVANPGVLLVFSVQASDADVPVQTLLYSFGPGAPAGADISVGGLFTWAPSQAQASTTNRIRVVVSDGSLTATQAFTVVVLGGTLTPPRLVNPAFSTNAFSASVDSLAGRRYFLERSVFLAPSEWQTVGEFQGTGGMMLLTDPRATNAHSAYRARVQ